MLCHDSEFVLSSYERANQFSLLLLNEVIDAIDFIKEAVQPLYS